jgi:hypothetical protein
MSARLVLLPALLTLAMPALAGPPESPDPRDALVRRMDHYFTRNEVDGVVLDGRWVLNETEAVRLSVTPQLLGFVELERRHPGHARDIQDRADYLVARLDQVRSGSVFDGMLAYALLEAYGVTGDPAHLAAARVVLDELEAIPASELVLNGGLMTAMGFAREYARTGDPRYAQMTRDIVAGLAPYQNEDGSFPHWCGGSEDVHYTDWMAQELILIGRLVDDPAIEPLLVRMNAFLEARVGDDGVTRYQGPCPNGPPGCARNYWSLGTGCAIDVETRAYTNELGYTALLFDHVGSPKLPAVLAFLDSIEDGGVVADRWEGPIDPKDPYYPWTAADTSVVNMSLLFWSLAAMPPAHGPDRAIAPPSLPRRLAIAPNPASGMVRIEAAAGGAHAAGTIRDIRGRIVRSWAGSAFTWDGRDERGMTCPPGVYLVELRTEGRIARGRVVLAGER